MRNFWKLTAGAIVGGLVGGYFLYQGTDQSETNNQGKEQSRATPQEGKKSRSTRKKPSVKGDLNSEEKRKQVLEYLENRRKILQENSNHPKHQSVYKKPSMEESEELYEDDENRPPYYIPLEDRASLSYVETEKYFNQAIEARDYSVAKSYIPNIIHFAESNTTPEAYPAVEDNLSHRIAADYEKYLHELSQKKEDQFAVCEQDYWPVLRKIIWMEAFLRDHQKKCRSDLSSYTIPTDFDALIKKGETVLQIMVNCPE